MAHKELVPIVAATEIWGRHWSRKRILFLCDNQATCAILNKGRSRCSVIMQLIRHLTVKAAWSHFAFSAQYIASKANDIADSLSRFQMARFRVLAPHADRTPHTGCTPRSNLSPEAAADYFLEHSLSPGTLAAYESAWRSYLSFAALNNIPRMCSHMPIVNEDTLILFVSYCATALNLSYASCKQYLSGIRHYCITLANRNPLVTDNGSPLHRLFLVMRGIRRTEVKRNPVKEWTPGGGGLH